MSKASEHLKVARYSAESEEPSRKGLARFSRSGATPPKVAQNRSALGRVRARDRLNQLLRNRRDARVVSVVEIVVARTWKGRWPAEAESDYLWPRAPCARRRSGGRTCADVPNRCVRSPERLRFARCVLGNAGGTEVFRESGFSDGSRRRFARAPTRRPAFWARRGQSRNRPWQWVERLGTSL